MKIKNLLVLLFFYPLVVFCSPAEEAVRDQIKGLVAQVRSESGLQVQSRDIASVIVLPALYEQRDYAPLWTREQSVEQLISELEGIDRDGLDATDYHLAALQALRQRLSDGGSADAAGLAEFDLLLTDALVRLGYHLMIGKVDPVELDSNWNMSRTLDGIDPVLEMAASIEDGTVDELIESLRPDHPVYRRLKAALARYRDIADHGGWQPVPEGPTLKPGMSGQRVLALRRRLVASGEMPATDTASDLFDPALEAGVKKFQKHHGLEADGIAGKGTIGALNATVDERIDQIRVNLERARWILRDLGDEYVLVDIAGFNVRYVRDRELVWQAKAQVGKPYRSTPVFRSEISYLDINPTWTVPPTIFAKDVLPAIKRNPEYLAKKNMRVIDYKGNTIDAAGIDWSKYKGRDFPYLIRQDPGPGNALGRIKFMFPNKHSVYLHDTPSKSLFNRAERAFSSGCIRIQNPFEFAELLLDDEQKWNRQAITDVVETKQTQSVRLARPVTVILLYWTVNAADNGEVIFKQDIYDRDGRILAGLNSRFSFRNSPVIKLQSAVGL